jgi:hypothetical protein
MITWIKNILQYLSSRNDYLDVIKNIISIIQGIVIIGVTLFTAWWTYKTFAHKEKIEELKELKKTVELYHFKLTKFCAQVRQNKEIDQREIAEKLELVQIHNKIVSLASLNLYTKSSFREKILKIVGAWIVEDNLRSLQRGRPYSLPEEKILEAWKKFSSEYEEVRRMIDSEADRYI